MMILMSEGNGEVGHIEEALCLLSQMHHTCTSFVQHTPGQEANQYASNLGHVTLSFVAQSKELLEVV
jgi:sorbitol-specific phosphotransferase system component IIA